MAAASGAAPGVTLDEGENSIPSATAQKATEDTAGTNTTPQPQSLSSSSSQPQGASGASERLARFKALQARAKKSASQNLKEAAAETRRLGAAAEGTLAGLARKQATAEHELLKADTEAAGEDFERKRAWDWTADEAAAWDRREAKKRRHREDVAFADYRQEARKTYRAQVRRLDVDRDAYDAQKAAAVQRAAADGGLELVETEDGEVVAVDREGRFHAGGAAAMADRADFAASRPSKEGVDRLVENLKKAEEARLRARKKRRGADDGDPDVTYINEKNKQFNQKLARFYNKYTTEIRESFERGTMI